jgi:hypothetical protein
MSSLDDLDAESFPLAHAIQERAKTLAALLEIAVHEAATPELAREAFKDQTAATIAQQWRSLVEIAAYVDELRRDATT